jgi:hypothetical protein
MELCKNTIGSLKRKGDKVYSLEKKGIWRRGKEG